MHSADFTSDCGACAALCCLALPFDKGESFAHAKLAGDACKFLDERHGCRVHDSLTERGYGGCVRFECLGAGQRVTQEVFSGRSWRDEPQLVAPMVAAFRQMRAVQEARQMLAETQNLSLNVAQKAERQVLLETLEPEGGWTQARLTEFERGPFPERMRLFLTSLRSIAKR